MGYALQWLPEVLAGAGLRVAEQPGWRMRGRGEMGVVRGLICHHTAGPAAGNMPSLRVVTEGRADLPGPLAQLALGRDGTFYVVAAGRCNHAGAGAWAGATAGNAGFIGIEAENSGRPDDPWPAVQRAAYARGAAAILARIGADAGWACGHKEWALPRGRKADPSFDMAPFRAEVAAILAGAAPPVAAIPAGDAAGRATLRRGMRGEAVGELQRRLGLAADGIFGGATEAAVRAFQRAHGLVPDGIIGPKSWAVLVE